MEVSINNIKINYFEEGSGPDMLFLHGWGGKWQSWYPILLHFIKDYHVVALDLPGFGDSGFSTTPFSLKDYASIVSGFINKVSLKKPILFGHSFGGSVAAVLIANEPLISNKLILVDSSGIRNESIKKITSSFLSAIGKNIFNLPLLSRYSHIIRDFFYRVILKETDYLDSGKLKQTFIKVVNEDITPLLSKINISTLIIWGAKDNANPLWQGKIFNKLIHNSKLVVISNTGHFSYLENPERFIEEVEKFIK